MWNHPSVQFERPAEAFRVTETRLMESYQRCESAGVGRDLAVARDILPGQRLNIFLEKHQHLADRANSLFLDTFQHLQDQKALFILTDDQGRVIVLSSKPEVLALAATRGIVAGASLSESSLGTNAVSLALHHAEPVVIRGGQHFCRIFAGWYCVSVPIMTADGRAIACLDISTCHETLGEKLALANLLAAEFENYFKKNPENIDSRNNFARSASQISILTTRQQQVLTLFSQGLGYKEIAQRLKIQSHKTVEKHLDAIRIKVSAKTRRACIKMALKMGLL